MAIQLATLASRNDYMKQSCQRLSDLGYDKYAAVIIDGNSEEFKPLYLKDGFEGGCKAAQDIRKGAIKFLATQDRYDPEATLLVYVYANLEAIKGSFNDSNALENISRINQFQSGFQTGIANSQAILADLDVSEKSRMACLKTLTHMLAFDLRCTALILSDLSIEQCFDIRQDPALNFDQQCKFRITGLKTLFGEENSPLHVRSSSDPTLAYGKLTQPSHIKSESLPVSRRSPIKFDHSVLIKEVLASCETSSSGSSTSDKQTEITTNIYRENRKANSKATALQQGTLPPIGTQPFRRNSSVSTVRRPQYISTPIIPRDVQGRRIDPPLKPSLQLLDQIEGMRICNNYHLKRHCPFQKCKHLHKIPDGTTGRGRDLTDEEMETLRFIARRSPCRYGTLCNDPYCYAGHRCLNHIIKGRKPCSFPDNLHFEEMAPVNVSGFV